MEVATWIEEHEASSATVSLAGTSMSCPILGSELNDVSRQHETIMYIHAQVIDSYIAVNQPAFDTSQSPLYFDETSRSKPD
jgi:hypothetical protein